MEFEEFRHLFLSALETAVENAEEMLSRSIPRQYEIVLHGRGYSGQVVDVESVAINLYIDGERFYRVIDVAVQHVFPSITRIFVRVSGHDPVPLADTWNTPKGSGPFKQIVAQIQETHS